MRRAVAFIVLLVHINTSMFIPVADEVDIFDAQGNQVCDINTMVQYVDQIVLGHTRTSHSDSDDDQAHFFNLIKFQRFFANQFEIVSSKKIVFAWNDKPIYSLFKDKKLMSLEQDVIIPPPKSC